jgi:hypothetical protein
MGLVRLVGPENDTVFGVSLKRIRPCTERFEVRALACFPAPQLILCEAFLLLV